MSDTIEFMTFPPLNLIDKFRLGLTIFVASKLKNWKQLEKIPVTNWLKKWSGHSTFNKIWLPLLRAKLGENYQKTSAAFIWTTIQRMYAARRSGLKKEMFGYVSGGYAQIIESFKNILKAEGVLQRGVDSGHVRQTSDDAIEFDFNAHLAPAAPVHVLAGPGPVRPAHGLEEAQGQG